MQKLRKLPFVLAILVTLFTAACTEVEVTPRSDEDDNEPVIPPPTASINSTNTITVEYATNIS